MTGLRADNCGDIACIDHADVKIRGETYSGFIIVDGATAFVIAIAPRTKEIHETVQCLTESMDTCHCTPKILCVDMAIQSTEVQDFFRRFDTKPFSVGPLTPWPHRAEATVRVFQAYIL